MAVGSSCIYGPKAALVCYGVACNNIKLQFSLSNPKILHLTVFMTSTPSMLMFPNNSMQNFMLFVFKVSFIRVLGLVRNSFSGWPYKILCFFKGCKSSNKFSHLGCERDYQALTD